LWLFSFVLAAMLSLKVWMSVRRVFASGEGFVCHSSYVREDVLGWQGGVG